MKNRNLMNRVIVLFAFLLVTSMSFAQITTEEDMAKAVFKTIQDGESEALSFYCSSEKRMTKVINGLTDTSHVVISVKQDMKEANGDKLRYAIIAAFDKLLNELKEDNLNHKNATYEGITLNKIGMDIPNLMSKKIKFKISLDKITYIIRIDVFKTKDDMFLYDFSFVKE